MKILRIICVDCGLVRHPFVKECERCASHAGAPVKVAA